VLNINYFDWYLPIKDISSFSCEHFLNKKRFAEICKPLHINKLNIVYIFLIAMHKFAMMAEAKMMMKTMNMCNANNHKNMTFVWFASLGVFCFKNKMIDLNFSIFMFKS
jgi:hypothetical protein